jgi:hypothetical protein
MDLSLKRFTPGQRVRITQTIAWGRHKDKTTIDGEIVRLGQQKTGSWFAHARDDKLWIDRIELRRPDGEIVVCNLDQHSTIELLTDEGTPTGEAAGAGATSEPHA